MEASSAEDFLTRSLRRAIEQTHGESEPVVTLTGTYHSLIRMWADV